MKIKEFCEKFFTQYGSEWKMETETHDLDRIGIKYTLLYILSGDFVHGASNFRLLLVLDDGVFCIEVCHTAYDSFISCKVELDDEDDIDDLIKEIVEEVNLEDMLEIYKADFQLIELAIKNLFENTNSEHECANKEICKTCYVSECKQRCADFED